MCHDSTQLNDKGEIYKQSISVDMTLFINLMQHENGEAVQGHDGTQANYLHITYYLDPHTMRQWP